MFPQGPSCTSIMIERDSINIVLACKCLPKMLSAFWCCVLVSPYISFPYCVRLLSATRRWMGRIVEVKAIRLNLLFHGIKVARLARYDCYSPSYNKWNINILMRSAGMQNLWKIFSLMLLPLTTVALLQYWKYKRDASEEKVFATNAILQTN